MITGATSGIGLAAARILAADGARLTLVARNPERAQAALFAVRSASPRDDHQWLEMDFASLASVRAAARQYLDRGERLDVLLNNAGIVNARRRNTVDGYEETFAVNHLAPFLLTGILLPQLLHPGSRIVNVASNAHAMVRGMRLDEPPRRYSAIGVYGRSKLANMLFTLELAERLAAHQVCCNCLHPGAIATGLGAQGMNGLGKLAHRLLTSVLKTPEQGAQTPVYLCRGEQGAEVSGRYFVNSRPATPKPWATDRAAARHLWEVSEKLVDFRYEI